MENKVVDSSLADMKMSMQLLPLLANTIRKLRMQKMAEEAPPPAAAAPPKPEEISKTYTQNKWEVSPS